MAPKQKTFQLIPDRVGLPGLGHQPSTVSSKPPMTTKQAKKLYRQANKGPKLSKAEQRRIELMEQDRIRKEFEKEKAQARARTARERKKAKEEKEKEERRKKGLPLVDVHPSQDTISRFISRAGSGQKQGPTGSNINLNVVKEEEADTETGTEAGSDADAKDGDEDEDEGEGEEEARDMVNQVFRDNSEERRAKRPRLSKPNEGIPRRAIGPAIKLAQEARIDSHSRASSVDTDDPVTDTMLEDQLIADIVLASSKSISNQSPKEERQTPSKEQLPPRIPTPQPLSAAPLVPSQHRPLSPQPQKPLRQRSPAGNHVQPSRDAAAHHVGVQHGESLFKKPVSPYIPVVRQRPTFKFPAVGMPSAPPKFRSPAGPPNSNIEGPRFVPKHLQTLQQRQPTPNSEASGQQINESINAPPSSTQLLVLDHADELFPTPSQEARELVEGHAPDNTVKTATEPELPVQLSKPRPVATVDRGSVTISHERPTSMPAQQESLAPAGVVPGLPFLSTQDFVLSSQDIRDMDTPSKIWGSSTTRAQLSAATREAQPSKVRTERKSNNFTPNKHRVLAKPGSKESKAVTMPMSASQRMDCSIGWQRLPPFPLKKAEDEERGYGTGVEKLSCWPNEARSSLRARSSQDIRRRSRPSSQKTSPLRANSHPLSSSPRPSSSKPRRAAPLSNSKTAANIAPPVKTPQCVSPPKKRMFGSGGPGAEVLVAMERSYQQSRREERARDQQRREQERKMQTDSKEAERLAKELAEIAEDDLFDDDVSRGVREKENTDAVAAMPDIHNDEGCRANVPASQETDYGDFDFGAGEEELDILADMTWIDDDLDDCI